MANSKMKESVRRSTRVPRRKTESTEGSSSNGRSRKSSANEKKSMITRKRSRSNISEDRSPLPERTMTSPERTVPKVHKKIVGGRTIDCYCWICHKVVDEESPFTCSCSRNYHQDCLKKLKIVSETNFCECHSTNVDGRKEEIIWHPVDLKEMLEFAMQEAVKEEKKNSQKKRQPQDSKFCRLFKSWPQTDETDGLCKVVDLDFLIDQMNIAPPYSSTGQFFLDVKWIYHNCCIVYGFDSEITHTAQILEKNFKQELIDIEACRECYRLKHSENYVPADFYTNVCKNPHPIVWAKLRGSPFWPAKCLTVLNGYADVRFFGTHDKSNIPLSQVFKISQSPPNRTRTQSCRQAKYQEAVTELNVYVTAYEAKVGEFNYYEPGTPFVEHSQPKNLRRRHGKRKRSRTRHTEQTSRNEDTSEDELTSPEIGIEETDEIHPKETKGSDSKKSLKPLLNVSVLHDDLIESKAVFHQPSVSTVPAAERKNAESVKYSESSSNVVCHMTFSEEEENCQTEVHASDDFIEPSSASQCSESQSEHASLPSLTGSSDLGSEFQSSSEFVNYTESSEKPCIKENASNRLPVITSTMSPFVIASTHSAYENVDDISPHIPASDVKVSNIISKSNFTNDCSVSSLEDALNKKKMLDHITDHIIKSSSSSDDDDDDEIQVIEETRKKSLVDSVMKNETLTKTLCELLLSSRPTMREHFATFQNLALRSYLMMWLEVNSMRLESDDCKSFRTIYEKLLKKLGGYQAKNESLKKENESLKRDREQLQIYVDQKRVEEDQKKAIKSDIIKATLNKINASEKEKAASESKKVKDLEENMALLIKQNDEMKKQHALRMDEFKKKILLDQDEIKELRERITLSEKRYKVTNTDSQTDLSQACYENIDKDSSMTSVSFKSQDLPHLFGTSFPSLNEICSDTLRQKILSRAEVQHNSMVLLQQGGLQSPMSLSGGVMCENLMMSECSLISPPVHPIAAAHQMVQLPMGLSSAAMLPSPTCLETPRSYQQSGASSSYQLASASSSYRQSVLSKSKSSSKQSLSRISPSTSKYINKKRKMEQP